MNYLTLELSRPCRHSAHIFCPEAPFFHLLGLKLVEDGPQQSHHGIVGFQHAVGEIALLDKGPKFQLGGNTHFTPLIALARWVNLLHAKARRAIKLLL